MMENNLLLAFSLTALAGLATGFGSIIAFFSKRENKLFLAVSLGFSADELFPAAKEYDQGHAPIYALIAGMMIMALSLLLLI